MTRSNTGLRERVAESKAAAESGQTRDVFDLVHKMREQFEMALPRQVPVDRFIRVAITELRLRPQLQQCSAPSLLGALMTCAQLGLEPSGPLGHAYLVPFKNRRTGQYECTLIIGYKGEIELANRSGSVSSIVARAVYEGDVFEFSYGLDDRLEHRPTFDADRGDLIAVYAVARMKDGGRLTEVLSVADVEKFRARSRAKDEGPWKTDYEAMAKKTAVRRLSTWLPLQAEDALAYAADGATFAQIPVTVDDIPLAVTRGEEEAEAAAIPAEAAVPDAAPAEEAPA